MLIDQIVRETGFSSDQVLGILKRAPHAYCIYTIPKRSGNGVRVIAHPARQLKLLQRWIADRVLADLPIHESVYSYRTGRSVRDHACVHKDTNFLLRIDLTDFFPSITRRDVVALLMLRRSSLKTILTDTDLAVIAKLVCKGNAITIGSPSSPIISNAVLYDFDVKASDIASQYGAIYTRYADDLYFSTNSPNILSTVLEEVRATFRDLPFPRVIINEDKVVFTSRKRKKVVTGLVITPGRNISLGRAKKRHIRGLLHRFGEGLLGDKDISYLKGYMSYCSDVEPEFVNSVKRKYGELLLEQLINTPTVVRKVSHSKSDLKNMRQLQSD